MGFGFRVVYADQNILTAKGFGKVAKFPFIMDSRPAFHRLANQFLIDRGLGIWGPSERGKHRAQQTASQSLKNYADWLANFLEWCEVRHKDLLKVNYEIDLVQQYQGEMLKGVWSRDGTPLSSNTVLARVGIACEFQTWAFDKGLRELFDVPLIVKSIYSNLLGDEQVSRVVSARKGVVRETRRRLGFPTEREIFDWLERIYQKNQTEGVIAETILETAVRRAEAAAWRVDTLPISQQDWVVINPDCPLEQQAVLVDLVYGTKGAEYGFDHGDKIGPRGTIRLPMLLAFKIHEYRMKVRPKALAIAVRKGQTKAQQLAIARNSVHLFLNPNTGERYTGEDIYEFWRSVERPRGWSPHAARHFWACSVLWRRILEHKALLDEALEKKVPESTLQALQLQAKTIIQLEIQPQLRHMSSETTMLYLQWLADRLSLSLNLRESWTEKFCQDIEEEV